MAKHNETGLIGEAAARNYLIEHGYAILETNWRRGRNEVDIIAYMEGLLVFVEVKTRTSTMVALPEDAVDHRKQRSYISMADSYVVQNQRSEEVRFDIITVVVKALDNVEVTHIPNAFTTIG